MGAPEAFQLNGFRARLWVFSARCIMLFLAAWALLALALLASTYQVSPESLRDPFYIVSGLCISGLTMAAWCLVWALPAGLFVLLLPGRYHRFVILMAFQILAGILSAVLLFQFAVIVTGHGAELAPALLAIIAAGAFLGGLGGMILLLPFGRSRMRDTPDIARGAADED